MTTCDKCGHGARIRNRVIYCANPECDDNLDLDGSARIIGFTEVAGWLSRFSQWRTHSGLWLWVLDTGKGEA